MNESCAWLCCAEPCTAMPCPTWLDFAMHSPIFCALLSLPFSALPCPAMPCPALPCPALPCPALPCPALLCPALPCSALPCMIYALFLNVVCHGKRSHRKARSLLVYLPTNQLSLLMPFAADANIAAACSGQHCT